MPPPPSVGDDASIAFQEAADLVVAELIGPGEPESPVIVFGRSEPLQPGDVVTASRPLPDEDARVIATIESPAYLFWADDVAGAYFAHPVRFALVDAASGAVTVAADEWYAELNGETLWSTDDTYWDPADWVYESGAPAPEAAGAPNATLAAHRSGTLAGAALAAGGRSEAILINGWHPGQTHRGEMAYDVNAMKDAVEGLGAVGRTFARPDRASDRQALEAAFADARARLRPGDTLFVYLTGHGAILPDGTAFADTITETQLKEWLSGFAPCVKIVVQIHACHSGGFLDSMQQVADLTMVSTSEDGFSMPDTDAGTGGGRTWTPDPNPSDRGSENTSGMVEGLRQIAAGDERRAEIEERIAESGESFLQAAAALSFGHAMSVDFGAINGLTRPATRMGNDDVVSCAPPVEGDYRCAFTVDDDPRNHGPFIGMPDSLTLPIVLVPGTTDLVRVDGPAPFVPVEGVLRPEVRTFWGTGSGTVAGFSDVGVALDLILTYEGAEGTYEMGTGGGLPGAEPIVYAVACSRDDETPPSGEETPEAFYEQFVTAMNEGDAEWPLGRLHPSVVDTFGEEACRTFIDGLFEPTLDIEVTGVGDPAPFSAEIGGRTIEVPDAVPVDIVVSFQGTTLPADTTHLVSIGGLLHWFADCGG